MKNKVLIISYFYPPCNLPSARRIKSWVDNFAHYNVKPIVVTRHWEKNVANMYSIAQTSNAPEAKEETDTATVYRLPYVPNFRDRMVNRFGTNRFVLFRKFLSFFEIIVQSFTIHILPYKNLYFRSIDILNENPDIETVIVSASPFQSFHFGYLLKKKFPKINWIADYRDEWTSREGYDKSGFLNNLKYRLERRSEKLWLSNASSFFYVNDKYIPGIEKLVNKKGHCIFNGFNFEETLEGKASGETLKLLFSGTIYPNQNVTILAEGLKLFIHKYPEIDIKVLFLGAKLFDKGEELLNEKFQDLLDHIDITDRIPMDEATQVQLKADAFLMFPLVGMEGVIPSKVFAYLQYRKPILLCPSDNDSIQELLVNSGLGFVANSAEEVCSFFYRLYQSKINDDNFLKEVNDAYIAQYSIKNITGKIVEIINKNQNS